MIPLMQALFYIVSLSGLLYFLIARRKFDFYSLAYFSAIIYFIPGFFGTTTYHVSSAWSESDIHPETYCIMLVVMASICFSALISTYTCKFSQPSWMPPARNCTTWIALVIGFVGLTGLLAFSDGDLFQAEKTLIMDSLGRWHILFYTAATLGLALAYALKQKIMFMVFLLLLLFNVYLGFRSPFAIGGISVLLLWLSSRGPTRLLSNSWRLIIILVPFALFMFGYKVVAFAIRAGMWDIAMQTLSNPDTYFFMITRSEPFLTQHTLNEIVSSRFTTSMVHVYHSFYQLLFLAPDMGAKAVTFNSLYQPVLFPEVDYGLAANIWGQMWSAGGWALLVTFIIFYNLILALGNWVLSAHSVILRAGLAPAFCYWAFYLHRNELNYAINLEKRQILLFFVILMIVSLLWAATRHVTSLHRNDAEI